MGSNDTDRRSVNCFNDDHPYWPHIMGEYTYRPGKPLLSCHRTCECPCHDQFPSLFLMELYQALKLGNAV